MGDQYSELGKVEHEYYDISPVVDMPKIVIQHELTVWKVEHIPQSPSTIRECFSCIIYILSNLGEGQWEIVWTPIGVPAKGLKNLPQSDEGLQAKDLSGKALLYLKEALRTHMVP